jgi:hypothetical protein
VYPVSGGIKQDITWPGHRFPWVEIRFVLSHHTASWPSATSWRLASRLIAPFRVSYFTAVEHPTATTTQRLIFHLKWKMELLIV